MIRRGFCLEKKIALREGILGEGNSAAGSCFTTKLG